MVSPLAVTKTTGQIFVETLLITQITYFIEEL